MEKKPYKYKCSQPFNTFMKTKLSLWTWTQFLQLLENKEGMPKRSLLTDKQVWWAQKWGSESK